jgi:hypothetical protein
MRQITKDEAIAARQILVEECGFRPDDGRCSFVALITANINRWSHACHEYRFMGDLGFGGKFRNNGNHDNTPYVDCYPEHETPDRLAMIEAANRRLDALFNPPTIQGKIP